MTRLGGAAFFSILIGSFDPDGSGGLSGSWSIDSSGRGTLTMINESLPLNMTLHFALMADGNARMSEFDDTPVGALDPALARTRTGRIWTYVGDDDHPYIVYDHTTNRSRDGPEAFRPELFSPVPIQLHTCHIAVPGFASPLDASCSPASPLPGERRFSDLHSRRWYETGRTVVSGQAGSRRSH